MNKYEPATQRTLYFIGVTTEQSSIMKVYPEWAKVLGLQDTIIKGIDFAPHSSPELYREAVSFIKNDPLSIGALVTTHKIDLFNACRDMFDYLDSFALKLNEISSISKRGGQLRGHAKDPISSGLAMECFIPKSYWSDNNGDVLLLGAGGSALAMTIYLTQSKFGNNIPKHIIIANRSQPRLDSAQMILKSINDSVHIEYHLSPLPVDNDLIVSTLKPHSLIVNATGLGKDKPGSPITGNCTFPKDSIIWEINYRGNLLFKEQAKSQSKKQDLSVQDGWNYFIFGWTQVISEVFNIEINNSTLQELSFIAKNIQSK